MTIFEYIEKNPSVIYSAMFVILIYNVVALFLGGRKAEERFQNQSHQRIVFREKGASGHSNKSLRTKLGGASKVLDVVVTENELWLKGIWPMFSYVGTKFDLIHRIQKSNIKAVKASSRDVEIWFENESGTESHVVLRLKDTAAFTSAIGAQAAR
jgi:hypothetical protein